MWRRDNTVLLHCLCTLSFSDYAVAGVTGLARGGDKQCRIVDLVAYPQDFSQNPWPALSISRQLLFNVINLFVASVAHCVLCDQSL